MITQFGDVQHTWIWRISLYTHSHIQVCCTSPTCVIIMAIIVKRNNRAFQWYQMQGKWDGNKREIVSQTWVSELFLRSLLLVNLRVQPCKMCWLWKAPLWSRRFEQYTLLSWILKTSRVYCSKRRDHNGSFQSQHVLYGCTRKFTSNSYFLPVWLLSCFLASDWLICIVDCRLVCPPLVVNLMACFLSWRLTFCFFLLNVKK